MTPNILTMVEAKSAMFAAIDRIMELESASRRDLYGLSPNRTDRQLVAEAFEAFRDAEEAFACCLTNQPKSDLYDAEHYLAWSFDQNARYDLEPPEIDARLVSICEQYAYGSAV
jgi:hypothetical protein